MNSEPPPLAGPHEVAVPLTNASGMGFVYGFTSSFALLLGYNLLAYVHVKAGIRAEPGHYDAACGFPFTFYFYSVGGYLGFDQFLWSGLVGDVVFAVLLSAFIGWLCDQLRKRLRA